jgi:hypothetical protein
MSDTTKLWKELLDAGEEIAHTEWRMDLRWRYHPEEKTPELVEEVKRRQSAMFFAIKELYIRNRDELIKVADTDQKKEFSKAMDKCVADDMERIILGGSDELE